MEVVNATRPIRKRKESSTNPYDVNCDDGNGYVTKFKENPQSSRVLANEFICYKLATLLDLPIPEAKFINVKQEFIDNHGHDIFSHIGEMPTTGFHFGIYKIDKAYPVSNVAAIRKTNNYTLIPDILLFDQVIGNNDRARNKGNILMDAEKKEIFIIDHTHVFELGPLWTTDTLKQSMDSGIQLMEMEGNINNKLIQFVSGNNPFYNIINKMSTISKNSIVEIINQVPDEWNITADEKEMLTEYLSYRFNRVNQIIDMMNPHLLNWQRGGN